MTEQWDKAATRDDLEALAAGEQAGRITTPEQAPRTEPVPPVDPADYDQRDNPKEDEK